MDKDFSQKLQALFETKLSYVEELKTEYDNTNQIFVITTNNRDYILKIVKDDDVTKSIFWRGLNLLFGADFQNSISNQQRLSQYLNQSKIIAVPAVIKADPTKNNPLNRPYVILEKMPGDPIPPQSELEQSIMESFDNALQLGEFLANVHLERFDFFGNLSKQGLPLSEFKLKLFATLKAVANTRKALQDKAVQQMLPYFLKKVETLKVPINSCLIMLDCWPSQFLDEKNRYSALVDIESYIIGPVELELVLLELWLVPLGKFKEGYLSIHKEWPDLEEVRELYRFFFYLLYDCPEQGLQACIEHKAMFPTSDRVRGRFNAPRPRPEGYFNPFRPSR